MRFSFVASTASAMALLSQAGALILPTVTPVQTNIDAPSSFPIATLPLPDDSVNKTLVNGGSALAVRQEYPATMLMCHYQGCTSCSSYDLQFIPENLCFPTGGTSYSVAISQPSGEGLPYAVAVGPTGCAGALQIPAVNTCYNVNGLPVNSFILS